MEIKFETFTFIMTYLIFLVSGILLLFEGHIFGGFICFIISFLLSRVIDNDFKKEKKSKKVLTKDK